MPHDSQGRDHSIRTCSIAYGFGLIHFFFDDGWFYGQGLDAMPKREM
jgi:hypothetical protein